MPGFIDSHKHVNDGENAAGQMRSLLEAGYTTVLAGGGQADDEHRAARAHRQGRVHRPAHHRVRSDQPASDAGRSACCGSGAGGEGAEARRRDRADAEPGPTQAEIEVLKAILDEAKKVGVQVNVHAVSTCGHGRGHRRRHHALVHVPNKDWTGYDAAEHVAQPV